MMMLRRMMLRRKTDPKTGKHTLCEPAQLYNKSCALPFHTKSLARSPCIALISVPLATPCHHLWTCSIERWAVIGDR